MPSVRVPSPFARVLPALAAIALAALCAVGAASASHYDLVDVPFLSQEEQTAFAAQRLGDTEQLLKAVADRKGRAGLAKASGVAVDRLLELARMIDLMQVRGIGPSMVRLLQAGGIRDAAALRAAEPGALYAALLEINDTQHIAGVVPAAEILGDWIGQAKALEVRVAE